MKAKTKKSDATETGAINRTLRKMIESWLKGERHAGYLSEETESDAMAAMEQLDSKAESE